MKFMREMNARADTKNQSPPPKEDSKPANNKISSTHRGQSSDPLFAITDLIKNKDTALILGLLLLLFSENADKKLLFALVYILL